MQTHGMPLPITADELRTRLKQWIAERNIDLQPTVGPNFSEAQFPQYELKLGQDFSWTLLPNILNVWRITHLWRRTIIGGNGPDGPPRWVPTHWGPLKETRLKVLTFQVFLKATGGRLQIEGYDPLELQWKEFITALEGLIAAEPAAVAEEKIDPPGESQPPSTMFTHESTEQNLRQAFYKIAVKTRTSEWWDEVAPPFWAYKQAHPKYTYGNFTRNVLGFTDEKHVGRQLKKRKPPKTTQNPLFQPPKNG